MKKYAQLSDPTVLTAVLDELSTVVTDPETRLSVSEEQLKKRSKCTVSFYDGRAANILVFPGSTEEVSAIVKIAGRHRVPIIPYGGGTSLEGSCSATYGGICLDFAHMSAILSVNAHDLDVTVQPGLVWTDLNAALSTHRLFFPPDPGYGATIGGMVATSCSGTNAARYGTMKDGWVLGLVVVLADGEIVRTKGRCKKSSAGYDITRLMIGSEGTLGIVTEATLRLTNVAEFSNVATCAFRSVTDIVHVASEILRRGIDFQCIEYLDENYIGAWSRCPAETYPLPASTSRLPALPHLFLKLRSNSAQGLSADAVILETICSTIGGGSGFRIAATQEEADGLWDIRKRSPLFFSTIDREADTDPSGLSTDVCVPMSALAEVVRKHRSDVDGKGLRTAMLGHVGDGNFHSFILFDRAVPAQIKAAEDVHRSLIATALAVGGTITGEHGVGTAKAEFLEAEHGTRLVRVMKDIKNVLDPDGILNPGKIFPEVV